MIEASNIDGGLCLKGPEWQAILTREPRDGGGSYAHFSVAGRDGSRASDGQVAEAFDHAADRGLLPSEQFVEAALAAGVPVSPVRHFVPRRALG